jgi:hypothetical protein
LVLDEGNSISQVGQDRDVAQPVVGNWVNRLEPIAARARRGLTTEERAELTRLRWGVKDLRQQRDI